MSAKPTQPRQLITGDRKLPPKILTLLQNPTFCSKIAGTWPETKEGIIAILMDLPLFCKENELDASAVVLACNKILTTFEVFRDQADHDRKSATQPNETR